MTTPLRMTVGRWVALALGLPLVLALIGWTGVTEITFAAQASFPVRVDLPVQSRTVGVTIDDANITVGQAPGDRLLLTGRAHYSLVRSTVTWHRTPTGVAVRSACKFVSGNCSF